MVLWSPVQWYWIIRLTLVSSKNWEDGRASARREPYRHKFWEAFVKGNAYREHEALSRWLQHARGKVQWIKWKFEEHWTQQWGVPDAHHENAVQRHKNQCYPFPYFFLRKRSVVCFRGRQKPQGRLPDSRLSNKVDNILYTEMSQVQNSSNSHEEKLVVINVN